MSVTSYNGCPPHSAVLKENFTRLNIHLSMFLCDELFILNFQIASLAILFLVTCHNIHVLFNFHY